MRCILVNCVFPPEPVVSAKTASDVARALANKGHTVTVVTSFPSRSARPFDDGHKRRLFDRQQCPDAYEIIRCVGATSKKSTILSRFWENISFGLTSGWMALGLPRPNVIYSNTWPIFATGILCMLAKLRRIPIVINIQDVYPESIVSQGRARTSNLLTRLLHWIDKVIAQNASHLILISERFADIYRDDRNIPPDNMSVIPNWADDGTPDLGIDWRSFRRAKMISEEAFLLAYGGNIGVAAGVETVIEALGLCPDIMRLRLLIAGEGSQLAACRELARQAHPERCIFHSPWPIAETSLVLRSADVLILPTRGEQSMVSVPSKLISYMFAGRPIIALAQPHSDVAHLVERAGAGWVVPPDKPGALAEQIRTVMHLAPAELERMGLAGRDFALGHFTREACLPKVISILENVAKA